MDYKNYFKGKKITVMGLGLLGRGIGDIEFLAKHGAELIVTDLKTKEALRESIDKLKKYKNIVYVLGEHRLEDFRNRDMILKAAGVPLDSVYIEEARKNKIPVEMSTSLCVALTQSTVVGVTGTRGKSTTTHLLFDILKEGYKGKKEKVYLGGNVKGVSTLAMLPKLKEGDVLVLELDSWQLQGFGERKMSPHVAVFTTFMPDHLNYYKGDLKLYFNDKAHIFKWQKEGDVLICGEEVMKQLKLATKNHKGKLISVAPSDVPMWKYKIPGEHNKLNIALAIASARALNIDEKAIQKAVEKYKGVKGRLEFLRKVNGISIYNDTTATTPDATLTGLKALGSEKKVILIMGGADKQIDMNRLLNHMSAYAKEVVVIPGTGTERIRADLQKLVVNLYEVKTLKEALKTALKCAQKGDVVLFSPAFASFGMFKNEFDRGEQFNKLVASLK